MESASKGRDDDLKSRTFASKGRDNDFEEIPLFVINFWI